MTKSLFRMLTLSLHGYFWNLPDIIGGNAHAENNQRVGPPKELFIRWTQLNALMPAMQFSYSPWHFDEETVRDCRLMIELRARLFPRIKQAIEAAVREREPAFR